MPEYEDERIVPDDTADPTVTRSRRTRVVVPYRDRSASSGPLLALSVLAIVGIIMLLMFVASNTTNDRVSSTSTTSSVMGEHVTPDTVTVQTMPTAPAPAPVAQATVITPSQPVAERTVQVPGPTRTVTHNVPVPGPTHTVPGPTRTVTVPSAATPPSGASTSGTSAGDATSADSSTVALGTQARALGTVESVSDDGRSITIRHDALTLPSMPEGSDTFAVRDASVLAGVTSGDRINFVLERTDDGWSVVGVAASGR